MYRREHRDQLSFEEFFLPFGGKLSGNNRWIKLNALIPWDELGDDYASQFLQGIRGSSQAISDGSWRTDHQGPIGAHR